MGRINSKLDRLIKGYSRNQPIFGVYWDKSSSPTLIRTHDSEGMIANAGIGSQRVKNNFDKVPIFGDIGEAIDTYDNVFMQIPKLYFCKHIGKDFIWWGITNKPLLGFYLPHVFWDFENNKELDWFYVAKYKGSYTTDPFRMESKAGRVPGTNQTIVDNRTRARANNNAGAGIKGYQLLDVHTIDIIRTLMFIEFATLNMQSVMMGYVNGRDSADDKITVATTTENFLVVSNATASHFVTGQTISVHANDFTELWHVPDRFQGRTITNIEDIDDGNSRIHFDGTPVTTEVDDVIINTGFVNGFSKNIFASSGSIVSNTTGKFPCMYRGIESPYGDMWQWVDGVNITDRQVWVAKNAEDYASNVFASPYEQLGYVNSSANGFVREMGFDGNHPYGEFPIATTGASDSTFYADNYWQSEGSRVARFGGIWRSGSDAGVSCWHLAATSSSATLHSGSRLVKKFPF